MDHYVLITGASAGLGKEFAWQLAAQGFNLLLVARRTEKLDQLKKQLLEKFPVLQISYLSADLSEDCSVKYICDYIVLENISLVGLINNAGFGARGAFSELGAIRQREMLQVNIIALTMLTHALIEKLKSVPSSFIINVASTAAFQAGPNLALYYASKAFVLSFSEALHEELKGEVFVSALCPGATQTEFAEVANMSGSILFKLRVSDKKAVVSCALKKRERAVVIPGVINNVVVFLVKLLPRFLTRKLAYQIQK